MIENRPEAVTRPGPSNDETYGPRHACYRNNEEVNPNVPDAL